MAHRYTVTTDNDDGTRTVEFFVVADDGSESREKTETVAGDDAAEVAVKAWAAPEE